MSKEVYRGGFYKMRNGDYMEISDCDDGYDFTVYGPDGKELDGGILESDDWLEEAYVVTECIALAGYENATYELTENIFD